MTLYRGSNKIAKYYELEHKLDEIKLWYDGYTFGEFDIYNSISILKFVREGGKKFKPYWVNTSANTEIRDLIIRSDDKTRLELGKLIDAQEGIIKPIVDGINYQNLYSSQDNIYTFLVSAGYLKAIETDDAEIFKLQIPNKEVKGVFNRLFNDLVNEFIPHSNQDALINSIINQDMTTFETILGNALLSTSYFDVGSSDSFYLFSCFIF